MLLRASFLSFPMHVWMPGDVCEMLWNRSEAKVIQESCLQFPVVHWSHTHEHAGFRQSSGDV